MELKPLSADDIEKYDTLVDESAEGTVFHKSWWFRIFEGMPGMNADSAEIYGAFSNERLVAGFPVPYRKKFGARWVISPTLTPYSGAVFRPNEHTKTCTESSFRKDVYMSATRMLRRFNTCMYYPLNPHCLDMQPFLWSGFRTMLHYTYILKLDDLDAVWNNMTRKRRNDIKSSVRNGYVFGKDSIDTFTRLNERSLERQGEPIIGNGTWERIYAGCKRHNCAEVFTVRDGDEVLAGMLLVWDNKRSYYLGGGMNGNSRGGMPHLIWEAIRYTKEELGLNEFDFVGSSNPGIEFFMRHFGGDLRPFFGVRDWKIDMFLSLRRAGKPIAIKLPAFRSMS